MITTAQEVNAKALKYYKLEQDYLSFAENFTPLELCKLWYDYCLYRTDEDGKLIPSAPYDDEVYDALDTLGYWDMV